MQHGEDGSERRETEGDEKKRDTEVRVKSSMKRMNMRKGG